MNGIGMSGAGIQFSQNSVHKFGNLRVMKQGIFCLQNRCAVLPFVMAVFRNNEDFWYSMKLYKELSKDELLDPEKLLLRMRCALADSLWRMEAQEWDRHWEGKILESISPELRSWAVDVFDNFRLSGFRKSLIHGDPTIDNLAKDERGNLIILDPIPHEGKIPPWELVDFGKMIQSVLGYEIVKHPDSDIAIIKDPDDFIYNKLMGSYNEQEIDAAFFWAAVHMERMLPYADNMSIRNFATLTRDYLIRNRHGRGFSRYKESRDRVVQVCWCQASGKPLGEGLERVGHAATTRGEEEAVSLAIQTLHDENKIQPDSGHSGTEGSDRSIGGSLPPDEEISYETVGTYTDGSFSG